MTKNSVKTPIIALIVIFLVSLCFTALPQTRINLANAISTLPVDGIEYASGSIAVENSPLPIWYSWIGTSGTQVIYYALDKGPDYRYPAPIANTLGQHLRLADGTQVFVASALSGLEVYDDFNGDGIPQADYNSGTSELLYYMYINMSESVSMMPGQKTTQDSIPHYQWSITYEDVHGFLQSMTARIGVAASLILDHITLSYDFSVDGDVSNLKTSFDIGKVTDLAALDSSPFTLDGLSLALLYATVTYTSKPFSTYLNGDEYYLPTQTNNPTSETDLAEVQVDNVKTYEFVFGGDYTLNRGFGNETQDVNIEAFKAKAEAVALAGISTTIRVNPITGMGFFRNKLNLADLFGGSWRDFELDYETSSLMYRICFPVWDGMQIQHDPVYVGYLLNTADGSKTGSPVSDFPELPLLIVIGTAASFLLVFAVARKYTASRGSNSKSAH